MTETGGLGGQILVLAEEIGKVKTRVDGAYAATAAARKEAASEASGLRAALAETADWSAEIGELQSAIGELKEAIDALQGSEREPQVWDWTEMDQAAAAEAWATLHEWMVEVADRALGLVGWSRAEQKTNNRTSQQRLITQIPPCWRQHRDVVFLLSPLCQEWIRVFRNASYGTPSKALDWYDRHVPGVVSRIANSSAHNCTHACQGLAGWDGEGALDQVAAPEVQADSEVQKDYRAAQLTASRQQRQAPPPSQQQARPPSAPRTSSSSWSPTPQQDARPPAG